MKKEKIQEQAKIDFEQTKEQRGLERKDEKFRDLIMLSATFADLGPGPNSPWSQAELESQIFQLIKLAEEIDLQVQSGR